MFKVEILEKVGVPPLTVDASQVVVRLPNGTPVSLAALFGGEEAVLVSHCDEPDFNENLAKLGITQTVITEKFEIKGR